jgi:hypothetical protein
MNIEKRGMMHTGIFWPYPALFCPKQSVFFRPAMLGSLRHGR